MKIIFLGTGPDTPVVKNARSRSSVYFSSNKGFNFMIDCTPDFLEQVGREKIDDLDFILVTHAHSDAAGGLGPQLKTWLQKKDIDNIPVYMEAGTWDKIRQNLTDTNHIEPRIFKPNDGFSPDEGDMMITPFRVINNLQPGCPACGFRFDDIVYSSDVGNIPPDSFKFYKKANIVISDAAMWFGEQIKGHQTVEEALILAKKVSPEKFVLIQAGNTYPVQIEAEKEIQKYWGEYAKESATDVILAYDGMNIVIKEMVSECLTEQRLGIYMAQPHGRLLYEGKKKLIVKAKHFKNEIGKLLYLIEDSLCYGIIRLHLPDKTSLAEFHALSKEHMISNEELKKWWPGKEVLYSYRFDIIKLFETPRKVSIPQGVQTFVREFEFLTDNEMIHDVDGYDASKAPTDVLRDDWRIAIAWYSTIKSGREFKYTVEQVLKLGKKIYRELLKRETDFHPDKMTEAGKEFFDIVSKTENEAELAAIDFRDPKIWEHFKDMTVLKGFANIVGSSIKSSDGHIPNDLDIQFRMKEPPDYLKRAIEVRISKDFPYWQKLHFVWGDAEGPHDSHVPLYDLKLVRIRPVKKVEMQEIENSSKFIPMKPKKRFYQIDEALKYMFDTGKKYAMEKKFNGFRGIISKKGDKVTISSDQGRDISAHFQTGISEASKISNKDFVLDAEIVYKTGGRSEIAKYVTGKTDIPDGDITFHVFDIPYFGEDLTKKEWFERKQVLHSLNFTPHIKEVSSIIVSSENEAKKAITFLRNLAGSEGAMIKRYDTSKSHYSPGKDSDAWIKFRNEDVLHVIVTAVNKKEGGYSYSFAIKVADPDKFNSKYISDGDKLDLGNTFVTKSKFEVGDHITVNVEEVWKHEFKDGTIRYSVHKPKVMGSSDSELTPSKGLDDLAVSKGEVVKENADTTTGTPGIPSIQGSYIKRIKEIILPEKYDFAEFNPSMMSEGQLLRAWQILEQDYRDKKEGTDVGFSIEDVINMASLIYKEIIARKIPFDFQDSELFNIVAAEETGIENVEVENDEEGGTQSAAADSYWKNNWYKAFPESGKGDFVYHHHWRGLTEEETKKPDEWLMSNTDNSIHGDIRMEGRNNNLFGFTTFLGRTQDNRNLPEKDKLFHLSENKGKLKNLQGTWKLPQPHAWLDVGKEKPTVSSPEGVGATANKFATFFAKDSGSFEMGVWREHFFELFFKGKHINGRLLMQYAPIGGRRIWLIDMPEDQRPYVETHDLEEVKKELKAKGQDHLVWAKPGMKPELIKI
jgi:phosphoribosyl 1,2-cyclic phosphate phosphodiesterase